MSEIKVNGDLFKKANHILQKNHTTFKDEFNHLMKQAANMDQVPFGLEEYDTKDLNNYSLSLDNLDSGLMAKMKNVLDSMDIPLAYVINGYCRRVDLENQVPRFRVNFTPYK